jgi:hypothetical protein
MSQSPVLLGLDHGDTKVASAVRDLAGQRLASVVVPSCGELGARDSFVRGIETAWDSAGIAPEVTSTGTMA